MSAPAGVTPTTGAGDGLRVRAASHRSPRLHVYYADIRPPAALNKQRLRIQQFQRRWEQIKEDLPPQLTRRHIGMISIGGVIGTGLFLGSADALKHGGPIGALLGYTMIGSVVYCLCISIGEMIAFLPNVGGVVGLADLYVDRALGFSLGWAAWYNWSVTLPAEVTAAAILTKFWRPDASVSAVSAGFLAAATLINCFSSRVYGEFEFWFSTIKVVTIVIIIIISLALDLGASSKLGAVGFRNWKHPFADDYLGIKGNLGRFLGFWAVLMQASFSFFGSEVPGIAAGEVIDATRNVPRALQRVWVRITLFYLGGVFCAGLLIDTSNDFNMDNSDSSSVKHSPFVIAFTKAGLSGLSHAINAAVLLSAWSAAASDIYISSRFLFFLARCGHAPKTFASLVRYPSDSNRLEAPPEEEEDILDQDEEDLARTISSLPAIPVSNGSFMDLDGHDKEDEHEHDVGVNVTVHPVLHSEDDGLHIGSPVAPSDTSSDLERAAQQQREPWLVLPLYAVLGSASVGLLCFLDTVSGAETTFTWLVAVASIASLQSWAGMLFTYIRWHKGTVYAEKTNKARAEFDENARKVMQEIVKIKEHRHSGQPYLAIYAFSICMVILFTNGWSVFVHSGWRIAIIPDEILKQYSADDKEQSPVSQFLSSYIPIPFFLLLTFGYKLIHQTKMVPIEEMSFSRENVPPPVEEPKSDKLLDRILGWLLVR